MIARKFLTVRRRVAGCSWTLLALTILAMPSLSWAACNNQLTLGKDGSGLYDLGDIVTVSALVGGSTADVDGALTVSEFRFALDCISADTVPLANCLGYGVDPIPDAQAQDDADAIQYAGGDTATGNLTVTGLACAGSTFSVNSAGTEGSPAEDPNIVVITASPAVVFSPGSASTNNTCNISFKTRMNSYGKTFENSTTQVLRNGGGFRGTCPGDLSSTPTASDRFELEVIPDITIKKYVNLDSGGYEDAQDEDTPYSEGLVPTSTALYELVVTNTGTEPLDNVLLNDATLGLTNVPLPARCYDATSTFFEPGDSCTIDATDTPAFDPLGNPPVNVCATSGRKRNDACTNGDGAFSDVEAGEACDEANVTCVEYNPDIDIVKEVSVDGGTFADANTEPPPFPAGIVPSSTAEYRLTVTNTGDETLINVVLNDPTLGLTNVPLPASCVPFAPGDICVITSATVDYSALAVVDICATPGLKTNIAAVAGEGENSGGPVNDDDPANVNCLEPDAEISKICRPDPVSVGATIYWEITIENTGDVNLECLVNDATAGLTDEPCDPVVSDSCTVNADRTVVEGDAPTLSNSATATCTSPDYTITPIDLGPATADCEVTVVNELCRTPGFWKTHGGEEKAGRSTNLVQEVIDSTLGNTLGLICGDEITNTSVNGYTQNPPVAGNGVGSALEGMCVHPKTQIVRQLQRQLIAASLNCVVSGGSAACEGVSVEQEWEDANIACTTVANGGTVSGGLSSFIEEIDKFNNGEDPYTCSDNIKESDLFDGVGYKVPGPAGSSRACNAATYNDYYLVPNP